MWCDIGAVGTVGIHEEEVRNLSGVEPAVPVAVDGPLADLGRVFEAGTAIALGSYSVLHVERALAALFVALAIQLGTNLVNDAADHARGADTAERLGPPRAVALGLLDSASVIRAGLVCFGIAGIAGVAIGLYAKVTSEMGSDYIVQSFMTVVVGGVGNIWGTLAGAAMIGGFQKGIEFLNPSNTLAAQTYMIIFIIIFIQFRPRGIIALKGRAAGD